MKPILTTLCLTMLLVSSGVCWSADFQKGVDAYHKGDYATAIKQWAPLAEQGYGYAQAMLGSIYYEGEGVPQDYQAAVKWYTLSLIHI